MVLLKTSTLFADRCLTGTVHKVMKNYLFLAISLLLLVPGVKAQAVDPAKALTDQLTSNLGELRADIQKRTPLADTNTALEKEHVALTADVTEFSKERKHLDGLQVDFSMELKDWSTRNAAHDALPICVFEHGHPEQCAAYTAEAQALEKEKGSLSNEGKNLDAAEFQLEDSRKQLTTRTENWAVATKKNISDINLNESRIAILQKFVIQIQIQLKACQDALKTNNLELIHAACGAMFDGNRVPSDTNVNQGTGTRMYGEGANPTPNQKGPHN
jgi:hypothetical protein